MNRWQFIAIKTLTSTEMKETEEEYVRDTHSQLPLSH